MIICVKEVGRPDVAIAVLIDVDCVPAIGTEMSLRTPKRAHARWRVVNVVHVCCQGKNPHRSTIDGVTLYVAPIEEFTGE